MAETEDYDKSATPKAHKTTHQDGGSDEISVLGLSGLLVDGQTPLAHKTTHQFGGSDALSVAGLSGLLGDPQTPLAHVHAWVDVSKSGSNLTDIATRSHTSLSDIGSLTHQTLDSYLDQALKQASDPTFAHLHLSDLAAIYTPVESWIGPSLAYGIYFKGGNIGFGGVTNPIVSIDIGGTVTGAGVIRASSNWGLNNTGKSTRYIFQHYEIIEEDIMVMGAANSSTENNITFGGGSASRNAATKVSLYTAANNITLNGTERLRIDKDGDTLILFGLHVGGLSLPGDNNLLVDGTATITGGFGCNAKTPQTPYSSGTALSPYVTGAFGLDSAANMSALHAMVVSIRAALVANGIMS